MKKQWISVKCGLSRDPKHRQIMGESVWLFLHILDTANWETGIASDWKDEAAAEEMGMPIRTLREHRRKLDEAGYITCNQKQYTQDIIVHNWTNPREYTGKKYNVKQGDIETSPEESQGYTQGYTQGNTKDVTPTYNSNNKESNKRRGASAKTPTPPEVKLFREVTRRYPHSANFENVVESIGKVRERLGRDVTADDMKTFYSAWTSKGYNPLNLAWLEWAETGQVPANGSWKAQKFDQEPKAFEAIRQAIAMRGTD